MDNSREEAGLGDTAMASILQIVLNRGIHTLKVNVFPNDINFSLLNLLERGHGEQSEDSSQQHPPLPRPDRQPDKFPENIKYLRDFILIFQSCENVVWLAGYTAVGAKIFQLLELPSEKVRLETHQALLLTEREIFLATLTNNTDLSQEQYQQVTPPVFVSWSWIP